MGRGSIGKLGLGTLEPSLAGGNDFAFGGAQTGTTLIEGVSNIDLPAQIAAFKSSIPTPVSGALYTLDIGANDILNGLGELEKGKITSSQLDTVVLQAIANTVTGITSLYDDGARNLLFYDVPQLGLTPDFNTNSTEVQDLANGLANTFNVTVLSDLAALESEGLKGLKVFNLNTYALLGDIVNDPTPYNFTNVTEACIDVATRACWNYRYTPTNGPHSPWCFEARSTGFPEAATIRARSGLCSSNRQASRTVIVSTASARRCWSFNPTRRIGSRSSRSPRCWPAVPTAATRSCSRWDIGPRGS